MEISLAVTIRLNFVVQNFGGCLFQSFAKCGQVWYEDGRSFQGKHNAGLRVGIPTVSFSGVAASVTGSLPRGWLFCRSHASRISLAVCQGEPAVYGRLSDHADTQDPVYTLDWFDDRIFFLAACTIYVRRRQVAFPISCLAERTV
mgnify:CR=1 FL=1